MIKQNELQKIINKFTDDNITVFTNYAEYNAANNRKKVSVNNNRFGEITYYTNTIFVNLNMFKSYSNVNDIIDAHLIKQRKYMTVCNSIDDCVIWTLLHELNHHFNPNLGHTNNFYSQIQTLFKKYKSNNISKRNGFKSSNIKQRITTALTQSHINVMSRLNPNYLKRLTIYLTNFETQLQRELTKKEILMYDNMIYEVIKINSRTIYVDDSLIECNEYDDVLQFIKLYVRARYSNKKSIRVVQVLYNCNDKYEIMNAFNITL